MREVSLFQEGRFCAVVSGSSVFVVEPTLANWEGQWAEGRYDETWWLYGGGARQRPVCPVVADGLILRGVRPGSMITIEGQQYECSEGGDVELSFQYPGLYEVTVSRWPYLDGSYTVENPPPAE